MGFETYHYHHILYWNKKKIRRVSQQRATELRQREESPPLYINSCVAVIFKLHRYRLPYYPCPPNTSVSLPYPDHTAHCAHS